MFDDWFLFPVGHSFRGGIEEFAITGTRPRCCRGEDEDNTSALVWYCISYLTLTLAWAADDGDELEVSFCLNAIAQTMTPTFVDRVNNNN